MSNFRDIRGAEQSSARAMVKCPYCRQHRSRRTRACICCKARALPSCRPERCMILAGLTSESGLDRDRSFQSRIASRSEGSWTLCRGCFRERTAMMFLVQATRICQCRDPRHCRCYYQEQYCIIAEIISHYCGGPWTENHCWFYWRTYRWKTNRRGSWESDEGERAQEEIPQPEPWHLLPLQLAPPPRTRRWNRQ